MRPNGYTQGRLALIGLCMLPLVASGQGQAQANVLAIALATMLAVVTAFLTFQGRWGWRALWWHATTAFPVASLGLIAVLLLPLGTPSQATSLGPLMGAAMGAMVALLAPILGQTLWPPAPDADATLAALIAARGVAHPGPRYPGAEERWTVATSFGGSGVTLGHDPSVDTGRPSWPRRWRGGAQVDPRAEAMLRAFHDSFAGQSWPAHWIHHTVRPLMFSDHIALQQEILRDLNGKPTDLWLPHAPTSAHQRLALLARVAPTKEP